MKKIGNTYYICQAIIIGKISIGYQMIKRDYGIYADRGCVSNDFNLNYITALYHDEIRLFLQVGLSVLIFVACTLTRSISPIHSTNNSTVSKPLQLFKMESFWTCQDQGHAVYCQKIPCGTSMWITQRMP